jgi:Flp pilus assembly protein TadG
MSRPTPRSRRAAVTVESAFVMPVLLFLIVAIVVGGYGVFRFQQVAVLAREGARYASVHGGQYQRETGNPAATQQDVYNNAVLPLATSIDPAQLSCSVSWNTNNMPSHMSRDYEKPVANTVSVTVSYTWLPEVYLVGPFTLSSTSTVPMSY